MSARPKVFLALAFLCLAGCRGGGGDPEAGLIIVSAREAGEVRRVLATEGTQVAKGTPLVEISVRDTAAAGGGEAGASVKPTGQSPVARAGAAVQSASQEIEAARAEVVRTETEVARLTPLVSGGQASAGELDGARANYERAQQRLQQAQRSGQGAQEALIAARQPGAQNGGQTAGGVQPPEPFERSITVTATEAGKLTVLQARVGQRVTAGQPIATIRR